MKKYSSALLWLYYGVALAVDAVLLLAWLVVAGIRVLTKRESFAEYKERFGFGVNPRALTAMMNGKASSHVKRKKMVWLHAPSLGETLSVSLLMTELQKNIFRSDVFFVITCQSPSARQALKSFLVKIFPANNFHLSLSPFDNLWLLNRRWQQLRPDVFFLVESDFLPRRALWLAVHKIPSFLLNGRISRKSFLFFHLFYFWRKIIFSNFALLWAQSARAQYYLSQLAGKPVFYHGNLKLFKQTEDPDKEMINFYKKTIPQEKYPLLFACLHPGEEKIMLKLYKKFPELKKYFFTIIVPRHPARHVWTTSFKARTQENKLTKQDFLQVSAFGHLTSLYSLCPLVLLGGSWVRRGGHNPKEALDQGGFVLHGKHVNNAYDIYHDTDKRGLTWRAHDINAIYKKIIWFRKLTPSQRQDIARKAKNWQVKDGAVIKKITQQLEKTFMKTFSKKI